jgi:predicted nucleotidyltransferase component of viral defense system
MISKTEITAIVQSLGLTLSTVEKDYVLGWVLASMAHCSVFAKNFVFKGGTCLRKCYFENYRFSEDLDFTIIDVRQSQLTLVDRQVF